MDRLTKFLAGAFPRLALRRMKHLIMLEQAKRVYDAALSSSYHVAPTDQRSADAVMEHGGAKIRKWARHLDENHDLSIGVLDVLVNNVVGTGISSEPMVMTRGGVPAAAVNDQIRKLFTEWAKRPEVTGELTYREAQRLACRAWFRDGECFTQHVRANRVRHSTAVPYSFELIESDYCPYSEITGRRAAVHGIEKDGWGRPIAYHFYKSHPGNTDLLSIVLNPNDLRRLRAEEVVHLKFTRRFRQTRGVSVFHGVIRRLADIKDYEESERIAARVAASLTAFIKKGEDFTGQAAATSGDRSFEMQAGMIFDNLQAGEDVGMVKSDRPNDGLDKFIQSQQRALAAGTGTNYSSISRDYNGTYSAQRQELVESQPGYGRLRDYFVSIWVDRVYVAFVEMALAAGLIAVGPTVDQETLFHAEHRAPGLPWIDPLKEIQADVLAIEKRLKSRHQTIRDRGGDPHVVDEQIAKEREKDEEAGIAIGPPSAGAGDGGGSGDADGGDAGDGDDAAVA